jgi:hypothetical protein
VGRGGGERELRDACDAGPARLERLSAAQPVHRLPLRRLVPSDVRDALRAAQPELAPEKLDQLSRPSTACRWCSMSSFGSFAKARRAQMSSI